MLGAILGGAALGVGLAGQMGAFGKPKQYGYSTGDIDYMAAQRNNQIDEFQKQLAAMRSEYIAQIPGLNKAAFDQFGGDAAAKFGAHGLTVGSGAFQSSLARAAIPMQARMYDTAYTSGINNATAVDSARGNLFSGRLGAASAGLSAPTQNPAWAGLGSLGGQLMGMSMGQGGKDNSQGTGYGAGTNYQNKAALGPSWNG